MDGGRKVTEKILVGYSRPCYTIVLLFLPKKI